MTNTLLDENFLNWKEKIVNEVLDGSSLHEFDCVELAGELIEKNGGRLVWIEHALGREYYFSPAYSNITWKHHAIAVIGGYAIDPWEPGRPETFGRYIKKNFKDQDIIWECMYEVENPNESTNQQI
jgi:hypothetical protein